MTQTTPQPDQIVFEGEDANAGLAAPKLDLIAAAFLALLSIVTMIASLRLPVPGGFATAPGLLPFAVAASLLVMSLMLGATAIKRHRAGVTGAVFADRDREADRNTLALAAAVAIYIAGLQFLAFRWDLVIGTWRHSVSAFEPVTIVALAAIIHFSWRGPLWITVAISAGWTLALTLVFQHIFVIPLPGRF